VAPAPSSAAADEISDFFHGKTIHIIVGAATGAAYDTAARLLATHMTRHVPGNPSIVVENMVGAASLKMVNYVYNSAPHDGTVIGEPNSSILLEPRLKLLSRNGGNVQFDLDRLLWLGTAMQEPQILWFLSHGPIESVDDLKTQKAIVGATDTGSDNYVLPTIVNKMLGTKMEIVAGYPGPNDFFVAAERGELQGAATALSNLRVDRKDWWEAHTARVLVQFGTERDRLLPDVPTAIELAPNESEAQMMRFLALKYKMARVFFLPPETPIERAEALRRAFDETMKDPLFLDQSKQLGFDISPLSGEDTTKFVQQIQTTPASIVDGLRAMIAPSGG
jgi:tripartite-type tricarboxylate transporter receptor subunit TctC